MLGEAQGSGTFLMAACSHTNITIEHSTITDHFRGRAKFTLKLSVINSAGNAACFLA